MSTERSRDGKRRPVLSDPRAFNFLIMALYAANAVRWAVHGSWADCCYWLSALAITATVTFGYQH
jgi:hypothetical protein